MEASESWRTSTAPALRVKAVVIFVSVTRQAIVGVKIGEQNIFEPGVRAQSHIKCVFGGIADKLRFIRLYEEKKLVAVDEPNAETLVHSRLPGKASRVVDRGVERIVRRGNIKRERGSRELCFRPILD